MNDKELAAALNDDGDALRLAVKLRLSIMLGSPGDEKPVVQVSAEDGGEDCVAFAMEPLTGDLPAATRRAIVRAAAAIDAPRAALAKAALQRMADNAAELGLDYEPFVDPESTK
jgi:hypothetical protein